MGGRRVNNVMFFSRKINSLKLEVANLRQGFGW
jgi:hypothetical protein